MKHIPLLCISLVLYTVAFVGASVQTSSSYNWVLKGRASSVFYNFGNGGYNDVNFDVHLPPIFSDSRASSCVEASSYSGSWTQNRAIALKQSIRVKRIYLELKSPFPTSPWKCGLTISASNSRVQSTHIDDGGEVLVEESFMEGVSGKLDLTVNPDNKMYRYFSIHTFAYDTEKINWGICQICALEIFAA